jgi:hypothetical protein
MEAQTACPLLSYSPRSRRVQFFPPCREHLEDTHTHTHTHPMEKIRKKFWCAGRKQYLVTRRVQVIHTQSPILTLRCDLESGYPQANEHTGYNYICGLSGSLNLQRQGQGGLSQWVPNGGAIEAWSVFVRAYILAIFKFLMWTSLLNDFKQSYISHGLSYSNGSNVKDLQLLNPMQGLQTYYSHVCLQKGII